MGGVNLRTDTDVCLKEVGLRAFKSINYVKVQQST